MPFERMQKRAEVARHLPPPLYVLLVQASAYGQACGNADASLSPDFYSSSSKSKNHVKIADCGY